MADKYEIDFPYLNHKFNRGNFVKNIIFLHFLPYIMEPSFEEVEERKKWQRLIALKTQMMILDIQDTENKKKKYKLDALNNISTRNNSIDYFPYKLEYDFYQSLGGDEAFFNTCIWNDVEKFIKDKAGYLMSVYTVVKLYMKKWEEYKQGALKKEPSLEDCHQECADRANSANDYPFQTYSTKTIKDNIWGEFRSISNLIYGYVEALVENGVIKTPEANINKTIYVEQTIAPILAKLDDNSKYLKDIVGYTLKAQNCRLNNIHSNSNGKVELWLLPEEKLKNNYGLKSK